MEGNFLILEFKLLGIRNIVPPNATASPPSKTVCRMQVRHALLTVSRVVSCADLGL